MNIARSGAGAVTVLQTNIPSAAGITGVVTIADLVDRLDGICAERIRVRPAPGTATEQDVIDADAHEDRHCELIDGVLVEKTVGIAESLVAIHLAYRIGAFLELHKLGVLAGEGGTIRLLPGQVRIPDLAFYSWNSLPGGRVPSEPIPAITPDLAIEVLSVSNTKREMSRKLREYFQAGTQLVWYVDPIPRTVVVYTEVDKSISLKVGDVLEGGTVLPGFRLTLQDLFAALDRTRPA